MYETWKDIAGYEGLYQVSDSGQVRSFPRKGAKGGILKPRKIKGYLNVILCKDGKIKNFWIHRLVAGAFLPNPLNLLEINHKDEDKTNNSADNLEWCNRRYNCNFGTGLKRLAEKLKNGPCSKQILQYDRQDNFLKKWPSAHEIERSLGFNHGFICKCCRGKLNSAYGYVWKYA